MPWIYFICDMMSYVYEWMLCLDCDHKFRNEYISLSVNWIYVISKYANVGICFYVNEYVCKLTANEVKSLMHSDWNASYENEWRKGNMYKSS